MMALRGRVSARPRMRLLTEIPSAQAGEQAAQEEPWGRVDGPAVSDPLQKLADTKFFAFLGINKGSVLRPME